MPTTVAGPYDTDSKEYKRAKRLHEKTTRGRNEQIEGDWTPFRAAEKKYKAKFPPPDLSGVLDLALLDKTRTEEVECGKWKGAVDAVEYRELDAVGVDAKGKGKAYMFPRVPGLALLPSFITPEEQRDLVRSSLKDHARHPNETNLDTHYRLPEEGLWNAYVRSRRGPGVADIQPRAAPGASYESLNNGPRQLISNEPASKENFVKIASAPAVPAPPSQNARASSPETLIQKLRWANIGWYYHWGNKQYDFTREKIPVSEIYGSVCKRAVNAVPWDVLFDTRDEDGWGDKPLWESWTESYEPDAGIVNFYQTKDTLMAHVDRSEICATSPLVSISLGCAAVFLIGGTTRDVEPVPILLRSGDVVIMSGPGCRRAYHGVPRILENTLPPHFFAEQHGQPTSPWSIYQDYLRTTRININVRQVFPKGFEPQLP
ncbi:hypothetical protein BDY19DRAFT_1074506 [Irpex rosettiformis]|uniref:Uncharacterized protein n=1 Tax=Irpex rosettiformis TaxID=378272 RepID=A0ACB8TXS7_9APHY|nr:hypothetical protein BDY19DRAFT_1074506 [Irpex rosettiformis]